MKKGCVVSCNYLSAFIVLSLLMTPVSVAQAAASSPAITTTSLIDGMADLRGLCQFPQPVYKNVQYSSYDRRSSLPGGKDWHANSDGFGNAPIAGVEKVIDGPDEKGTGTYVLCDIDGPGAIVRTWTASMNGTIQLYLDHSDTPIYDGPAGQFMANNYAVFGLESGLDEKMLRDCFDHRDASYLPIPFAKGCRIVWKGTIKRSHFYEVQVLRYEPSADVATFSIDELKKARTSIQKVATLFSDVKKNFACRQTAQQKTLSETLQAGQKKELLVLEGSRMVETFTLKLKADDLNAALRQTILTVYCDEHENPQVESPVGDFFGAAPGINPYDSLPFTVEADGTMTCRYVMPFKEKMVIEFENLSEGDVTIDGSVSSSDYEWDDKTSMYFFARWRVNHDLISNDPEILDLPFVIARGQGRYVGTTTLLMNPSDYPSPNGGWWGEGDERIFVDDDKQPSIFGTGSEDYYNYSWSSNAIFFHPYCGQPRNDGPANRGFVANYRWHMNDSIPFMQSIFFFMELRTHFRTPGISYARVGYYYGINGTIDDHICITKEDVRTPALPDSWSPKAGRGSANSVFFQVEDIIEQTDGISMVSNPVWAETKMVVFRPAGDTKSLTMTFPVAEEGNYVIRLVTARTPDSTTMAAKLDGEPMQLDRRDEYNLATDFRTLSRTVSGPPVKLSKGNHTLTIQKGATAKDGGMIGLDFLWLQKR